MVLVVLAIVWAVLIVGWFKTRTSNPFQDSVVSFKRNLSVLERSSPMRIAPANRLRVATRPVTAAPQGLRRTSSQSYASAGRRPGMATPPARQGANAVSMQRRAAQRRRRDVLLSLMAGAAGSFLLALVPGMSAVWVVQIGFDVLIAGYVALLVQIRNLTGERERKVSYMQPARQAPRRRSSYDFGGYGDLELQQAAN